MIAAVVSISIASAILCFACCYCVALIIARRSSKQKHPIVKQQYATPWIRTKISAIDSGSIQCGDYEDKAPQPIQMRAFAMPTSVANTVFDSHVSSTEHSRTRI